jgi:predicted transcriptional regulator
VYFFKNSFVEACKNKIFSREGWSMNNGETGKAIELLERVIDELKREMDWRREECADVGRKLEEKSAESEGWRMKYEALKKRREGRGTRSGDGRTDGNDTIRLSDDILPSSIETKEQRDETLSSSNDTINRSGDTKPQKIATITFRAETINRSDATINSSGDTLPRSNETKDKGNEPFTVSDETIKNINAAKGTGNEELVKRVKESVLRIVSKKYKDGKIAVKKTERLMEVLAALAEPGTKVTRNDLVKRFCSTTATVHREIEILKKAGLIKLSGGRKKGGYVLTEAGKKMMGME